MLYVGLTIANFLSYAGGSDVQRCVDRSKVVTISAKISQKVHQPTGYTIRLANAIALTGCVGRTTVEASSESLLLQSGGYVVVEGNTLLSTPYDYSSTFQKRVLRPASTPVLQGRAPSIVAQVTANPDGREWIGSWQYGQHSQLLLFTDVLDKKSVPQPVLNIDGHIVGLNFSSTSPDTNDAVLTVVARTRQNTTMVYYYSWNIARR